MKRGSLFMLIPTLSIVLLLFASVSWAASAHNETFLQCLLSSGGVSISKVVYTPTSNSTNYTSILQSRAQNLKLLTPETPKPILIITPTKESHIQATILCSKQYGLEIRVRSGGHDFEGASYVARVPFVIIDMINLRSVSVDLEKKTAWVQAGAINGELFYSIGVKSATLGYPAGICPTVGLGGHISGGGYGYLVRKYGLAADHVIDARVIDAKGRVLNRKTMGKDFFWAIRGGGGGNFGVVVAWKLELVTVPPTVTVFRVRRTQGAVKTVHKWQYVAPKLDHGLTIRTSIRTVNASSQNGTTATLQATFTGLYLGGADALLSLMNESFPELGLVKEDCHEMPWVNSTVFHAGTFPLGAPIDVLLDRSSLPKSYFKTKSDFVRVPIAKIDLKMITRRLFEMEVSSAEIRLTPYGGRMDEISEDATPFPNRGGTLYQIQYLLVWREKDDAAYERHMRWMRSLYRYMARFVTKSPRVAYINYRDLDLGSNKNGNTSYAQASVWGYKYYKKKNFNRLVHVKTKVDPGNFFRSEQSIPSLLAWK